MMKQMPRAVKLLVKFVISLAFFSVLLTFVQKNDLAQVIYQVNWFYMAVTFAVTAVMVIASCAKWKLILDLKTKRLSFWHLFKIYLVGYFFSNILPSTVGGDVVRSYYAGNLIENQSFSAVSVFVERFSGIFFLFLLVAVAPLFQMGLYSNPYVFIPACFGLLFAFITIWIWKARNPFYIPNLFAEKIFFTFHWIANRTGSAFLLKAGRAMENLYGAAVGKVKKIREELAIAVDAIKQDKGFLYRLIFLTILFYVLTWVNVYTAFMAFDVKVDFFKICAIVPAIMLVAHVPVTLLGNLGYFESVFVFYFLLVGVGGAESLAMGLLLRIKMLVIGIIGLGTYLVYKQKNRLILQKTGGN